MPRENWKDFLDKTSDDLRLSRNERKCLQSLAEGKSRKELRSMRKDLVAFVYNHLEGEENRKLVEYLEDAIEVLVPKGASAEAAVSTAFFPGEAGRQMLLGFLSGARQSLDVCVFTITDDAVARALVAAAKRGVALRVISDDDKAHDRGSDTFRLADHGVEVRFDQSPSHMHHKFAIRDGKELLNGSYNWTRSAYRENRENIVIASDPKLVGAFREEFERLWESFRN